MKASRVTVVWFSHPAIVCRIYTLAVTARDGYQTTRPYLPFGLAVGCGTQAGLRLLAGAGPRRIVRNTSAGRGPSCSTSSQAM